MDTFFELNDGTYTVPTSDQTILKTKVIPALNDIFDNIPFKVLDKINYPATINVIAMDELLFKFHGYLYDSPIQSAPEENCIVVYQNKKTKDCYAILQNKSGSIY